ncbi:MAG: DNA mismatch repair protein MutS [Cyclobacteriaceae bacterium]|nr:DNA mismatch repair protein MutS [Cyclobacteriaceae bacterium]
MASGRRIDKSILFTTFTADVMVCTSFDRHVRLALRYPQLNHSMFKSKKKNQEILQKFGKVKDSNFDFERIAMFFLHSNKADAFQVISESTCQDLDFEELFMYVDRTSSVLGQQYLYSTLRTILKDNSIGFENLIKHLNKNSKTKESTILELSRLNNPGAYYIQRLIFGDNLPKPKWFWVLPILSNISIITAILSFFYPVMVLVLLPIAAINIFIHFWNKNNLLSYSNAIPQLLILYQVASNLLTSNAIFERTERIKESKKVLRKIVKSTILFKGESKMFDEYGLEFFFDLIKGAFLIEPIMLFGLIKKLNENKSAINNLFIAVSRVDVALSIASFRKSLPYYAIPTFTTQNKSLFANEIYHPLITNPVSNRLEINDRKSILISGSNMSGKTTFIRTIGINTILAQTINTVCCKEFVIPRLKIHSAIRISDNLLDDTSYYYAEVKRIKELLIESESESQNLFLLDELFKGTNTVERIASGKAVLSYLNREDHLVLASTHDIELTDYLMDSYHYYHFSDTIQNNLLTFDYKLKEEKLNDTNAIRILEINDFPNTVTDEAKTIAKDMIEKKNV